MRERLSQAAIDRAFEQLKDRYKHAVTKHGDGKFINTLEILGSLSQEFHEVQHADMAHSEENFKSELLDLAVVCIAGYASLLTEFSVEPEPNICKQIGDVVFDRCPVCNTIGNRLVRHEESDSYLCETCNTVWTSSFWFGRLMSIKRGTK